MLSVQDVSKRYGDRQVLDRVAFDVGDGRLTGFVGANGAGKTTTMRIMLGVLQPDSGSVVLDGRPLVAADRRRFGYMPEERGLYPKMRLGEQLVYLARLHGVARGRARQRTAELLDRLGLTKRRGDLVGNLSLGNQQRAQIAAALVHDPEVLILDEPFSGLDPIAVETVLGVLQEAAGRGAPVLFSSHQLDLVERLCDDLVIIADGSIRAAGTRDELRTADRAPAWRLVLGGDHGWVAQRLGVTVTASEGAAVLVEGDPDAVQALLAEAVRRGAVREFVEQRATLAEIFREVVR